MMQPCLMPCLCTPWNNLTSDQRKTHPLTWETLHCASCDMWRPMTNYLSLWHILLAFSSAVKQWKVGS